MRIVNAIGIIVLVELVLTHQLFFLFFFKLAHQLHMLLTACNGLRIILEVISPNF